MKIRALILFSALLLVLLGLANAAIVFVATAQANRLAVQGTEAEQLIIEVFELNIIAQEYVVHHEERPRAQWYAQFEEVSRQIASPVFDAFPSREYIQPLRAELAGMKLLFDQIAGLSTTEMGSELEQQLSGDLLVKFRQVITDADEMASRAFDERLRARAQADATIFILLGLLGIIVNAIFYVLYRRIGRPIIQLQKGVNSVGSGKLNHRVGSNATDEIGELSRAFDAMTTKLKLSHDTLEQKVAERTRELAELNAKNQALLESIGDGVVAIQNDADWKIILFNAAAEQLTGWSRKEAIGKPLREVIKFVQEHDRTENVLFISDAMLSKKVRWIEENTVLIRKDGTEVPVGDSAAPVVGTDGKATGAIIVFRDVSSTREAQRVRSDFAYASHQLRTPMTAAIWSLDVAASAKKKEEIVDAMRVATQHMTAVQKIIKSLVEVSELDNKMVIPKDHATPVKDVLDDVVHTAESKANQRHITVRVESSLAANKQAAMDGRLLSRALGEILDNALHYSPDGSEVLLKARSRNGDVVFEIKDSGIGIPYEQQALIFTKFFRAQNVPTDRAGAGLGLYIAKSFLELQQGKVWFDSPYERGTTFFVSVPAVKGVV